jgi:hypothetical protein
MLITLMLGSLSTVAAAAGDESVEGDSAPPPAVHYAPSRANPGAGGSTGKVTQTMDADRYTYIEVETREGLRWFAGPQTKVKVGDSVVLSGGMRMGNFYSKHLDRTFDELFLVGAIGLAPGGQAGTASSVSSGSGAAEPAAAAVTGIARAEGGHTIAEILADRAALTGKPVVVRGQVVKVNSRILGKNWIHLEDGTAGPGGVKNLVVTTHGTAEVGSTVVVRGTVATDKDFGAGYSYEVLIEDASVKAE